MTRELASSKEVVFENPPLDHVAFEVRFPASLRVQPSLPDFQERIRQYCPSLEEDVEIATEKYWVFGSEDGQRQTRIAKNALNLFSRQYRSFETSKEWWLDTLKIFHEVYKIDSFSRLGIRYANQMLFEADPAREHLLAAIHLDFDADILPIKDIQQIAMEATLTTQKGMVTRRTAIISNPQNRADCVFLLDTDCFNAGVVRFEAVKEKLEDLHALAQEQFLRTVTPAYISTLVPKSQEKR